MATRTGARRTIYYTKQLSGPENSYARTHQYLGEWKDNQWEGKGTLEKTNGTRYVGEWKGGLRHGTGTLWQRHEDGSLRKIYAVGPLYLREICCGSFEDKRSQCGNL